jgi:hypothetical protein
VLTVAWQLQGAVFRHPRFADTSLEIHRQWQRRQLDTFPSVAASDVMVRLMQLTVRVVSHMLREEHRLRVSENWVLRIFGGDGRLEKTAQ